MKLRIVIPVISILVILMYLPLFIWMVQSWLYDPNYYHGLLIPIISGFIFWMRRHNFKKAITWPAGGIILGSGLVIYILSHVISMYILTAVSFLLVVLGIIAYITGREVVKTFIFPVLFLIFMIPLPFLDRISYILQNFTTSLTATISQWIGLPVTTSGNQIQLPDITLTVGAACSGINSLYSLLALAALLAFLIKSSAWKRAVIFISSVPIAILANIIRVTLIILIAYYFGEENALNYFHDFSSILLFLLALVLLILLTLVLRCKARNWEELVNG